MNSPIVRFYEGIDQKTGKPVRLRCEGAAVFVMPDNDEPERKRTTNKSYVHKKAQPEPTLDVWTCELPLPPSSNNLFLNVRRGRVKSPEYRAWQDEALTVLRTVRPWQGGYPVRIRIVIQEKVNRGRDASNFEKAPVDCLVQAGIIHNDNLKNVVENTQRYEPGTGHGIRVEIREDV